VGRKNLLSALLEDELTAVNSETSGNVVNGERSAHHSTARGGAVGAMSRSLHQISTEREELEARIAAGQNVIDLDPTLIDGSFIPDRMEAPDDGHSALMESIREYGQQVPILVRPHPNSGGRYQIAYGHRRVRVMLDLKRPVRAVIRAMNDDELVVAQGQENNARKDLSFIERATFASCLEERGFGRETIMAALAVDKTELSRLISVSRTISPLVVSAIGPAPAAGRRRWMELAERIKGRGADQVLSQLIRDPTFIGGRSDERFRRLFVALAPPNAKQVTPDHWVDEQGKKVARIERSEGRLLLSFDERLAPSFGDFVVNRLAELYRAFREINHAD
jgi:ParB family transcriptional regulator, chromosome partitioning protein